MAPNNFAATQARKDKRDQAVLRLGMLQTDVDARALGWQIAARNVGSAYKMADNAFRDALSKKAASDGLEVQIFFSVLTVVSAGGLGWVSTVVAKSRGGVETALSDAVEATSQAFVGEIFSANGPLVFSPQTFAPISQDPQVYQNELENKVDRLHKEALIMFNKIRKTFLEMDLASWDKYDDASQGKAQRDWTIEADKLAGDGDLPSVDWMAEELERGRWRRYVLESHSYRDFYFFKTQDTPDDVGGDVRSRLSDIVPDLSSFKIINLTKNEEENVVRYWAEHYTPQAFVEYKKNHPDSVNYKSKAS
jgi:hypothetical protein